jgi:hypothetical protein
MSHLASPDRCHRLEQLREERSIVVFQILPAEIEKGLDVMVRERFGRPRIDGGVYNDAHSS